MNLITIFSALFITSLSALEPLTCKLDRCTAPMTLNSPSFSLESTWKISARVQIHKLQRLDSMKMVRVTRYSSLCSEIPFNEYNQCNELVEVVPISELEAKKTAESGECSVGIECVEDGDCWGADSKFCREKERLHKSSPLRLTKDVRWFKFPYHTCTQHWGCEIVSFTPKIQLRPGWRASITTPIGEEIIFKISQTVINTPLNYSIVLNLSDQTSLLECNAQCISHQNRSICLIEEKAPYLVEFDSSGEAFLNSKIIKLTNHHEVAGHSLQRFNDLLDDSPLTIAQAKELQEQILYDNLQAHLNTKTLEKGSEKLYSIVFSLIMFLASKHPSLVSEVLGIPGQTTDSSSRSFIQCPCYGDSSRNCKEKQKMGDGTSSKECLGDRSSHGEFVNYTWASGIDWTTVPEIEFYASTTYQTILKELRSRSLVESMKNEEIERKKEDFWQESLYSADHLLKKFSWIAAWFALVLNLWLMHVWCSAAMRRAQ
nr:MAG: hemagglutinin [Halyomorpha halys orthomyxo-like virus 1]